jgi:GT2 family glycosyltransferase
LLSARVDIVIVSYNSRQELRGCVESVLAEGGARAIVVDNASSDGSLDSVGDLEVTALPLGTNTGFAHGCNAGWRAGEAPVVLFLNPDARVRPGALAALSRVLEDEPTVGAVAPRIVDGTGRLDFSQRRFPRLRSTYAQALFLHRVFPRAAWVDEVIRDEREYERPGSPDWVSGACIAVRRPLLETLGGLDDGFFMYCEDIDLCLRIRRAGFDLRYEPSAVIEHVGGASAPRPGLLPVLAASRIRFARKHRGRAGAFLERLGVAIGALTHIVVSRGGRDMRRGHARAFRAAAS